MYACMVWLINLISMLKLLLLISEVGVFYAILGAVKLLFLLIFIQNNITKP